MPPKEYTLLIRRSARKDLLDLHPKISDQVQRTIDRLLSTLCDGRRPQDVKPIKGRQGTFRIDTGEYRILFLIDEDPPTITISRVLHRKDAYRNL